METIEFMNFKMDTLYWCLGVITMLGLYELWRRWFVRLWNRRKHRVMEYRYEYKDDRHVYPKKEERIDESKLEYNGELPDLYLDNKEDHIHGYILANDKVNSIEQYMRRGNKRYFRGHNVKVIVTVEE